MNIKSFLLFSTVVLNAYAQHGHLNAGALGQNQNAQLFFANGSEFDESSGYVKTLTFTNAGRFAGYYEGNITLTALPTTPERGGPDPDASAPGSFIQFSVSCLSGPAGGRFGFWDVGSTSPSLSIQPGENGTNLFRVSESDGSAGSDPFGHIHGRRFTATTPGIYKIGFKVWDTSINGTNGGPIHTPSELLPVHFQAGINISHIAKTGLVSTVRYGSSANQIFTLEYTTNLAFANWLPIAGPRVGDDHFQTLEDPAGVDRQRFYRIKADPFIP